jgi:dihydrofolate reductase
MKVILYAATTLNGLIAKPNDDTSWISVDEWNAYSVATREAGNLIVGHRTYDILTKQPEFAEFKDVRVVVVANTPVQLVAANHSVVASPREALDVFESQERAIVAGGGEMNASFLAEGLVDEVYIDIEPILFGEGIPLFRGTSFERELKLIDSKKITENELQLHYEVLK